MMLLERSGIDVSSRSIWNERLEICQAAITKPSTANAWCAKVFRETTDASWKLSALENDYPVAVKRIARTSLLQAKDDDSKATLMNALNASRTEAAVVSATQALGNFRGTEVGDALLPLLTDRSSAVTAAAIQSLTKIKETRSPEGVRALVEASHHLEVRLAAVQNFGALG